MDQTNNNALPKGHMKAFWPLLIIFIIAALFGLAIYWYQFNLVTDYDLQSIQFTVHARPHSVKQPVKIPANSADSPGSTITK